MSRGYLIQRRQRAAVSGWRHLCADYGICNMRAVWFYDGRPPVSGLFQVQPKYALLGGVIGAFITYTVVRAMGSLGTAKAEITIVISQIAVAYIIELFGMFGSKRADFSWLKLLGLALAIGGVVLFNVCGNQE